MRVNCFLLFLLAQIPGLCALILGTKEAELLQDSLTYLRKGHFSFNSALQFSGWE